MMSTAETIDLATRALRDAGMAPLDPSDIRVDGVLARFDCEGDRKGKRNGWCVVFTGDRAVATFGHWARNIRQCAVLGSTAPMTPAEREQQRNAIAQAQAARAAHKRRQQQLARAEANAQWSSAAPAPALHPYLVKKRVNRVGIRLHNGRLLVPMRDEAGQLWNVQRIRADGEKRFLRGGKVMGLYCPIGGPIDDHLIVCEGWATGKTLHERTGLPVAVAFSAGNLESVAKMMRGKYPTARITVAADNDLKPDGTNPGLAAATQAAGAVDGYLAVPPIPGDFNDYANSLGDDATTEAILRDQIPHQ